VLVGVIVHSDLLREVVKCATFASVIKGEGNAVARMLPGCITTGAPTFAHARTHARTHTFALTHTHAHTLTHTLTLTHTHTSAHPHTHTHSHSYTHAGSVQRL